MPDSFSYLCRCCGRVHEGVHDLAFLSPLPYHELSEAERAEAFLGSDTCVVAEHRFVRGVIEIPIDGMDEHFGYGVWTSLSRVNFERYLELFEATNGLPEEPWFGWISNRLPGYPDTFGLAADVFLRPAPKRPRIVLKTCDHPLMVEQRDGISQERLRTIYELNEHPARGDEGDS